VPTWSQATPFGDILVVVGAGGIERISLPGLAHDFLGPGAPKGAGTAKKSVVGRVAHQLDEYFAGTRTEFDLRVDLRVAELSELQRRTLETVRAEVPYGETATYGEVAEMIGRPGAARAVGSAMARNPVPFVIPCHRVVAANGIGGYGGGDAGIALKRALLDRESRARPTR
jgi:methylated-DNA-[protein]-cysteine S-methyltransferase